MQDNVYAYLLQCLVSGKIHLSRYSHRYKTEEPRPSNIHKLPSSKTKGQATDRKVLGISLI